MKITISNNKDLVQEVKNAIKDNNGYCCCQLEKSDRTKCICKNFLEGPDGWCHCGIYYKTSE